MNREKRLTIFTPTYNRVYILPQLYYSLVNQTSKDFVWLIVDDGSTDNTESVVNEWMKEEKIQIIYTKQLNQGKSSAHNSGVELTHTELFTCVDSDDFLVKDAVERVINLWKENKEKCIVGILTFKQYADGRTLTSMGSSCIKCTLKEAYSRYHLSGDAMLIYRSDIIKQFNFPEFDGEKFVPEAYLYDLIDQKGKLLIIKAALYCCEYLEDGYTQNMAKLLVNNPKGYLAYVEQRLELDKDIKDKVLDTIRYTAMCLASNEKRYITKSVYPIITIFTLPIAYIFYIKRYKNL
ncbi:glycosyltransferase family 2 protein [Clostridium tagluense]|uniref:glycosyltransferase family 2 protein n=1 Tax=Clostridium tagluense TaxID=360422 RepID=UPI001CF1229E|nr:glycosyltransferase family A protein [Clostridium tagluense]MCB2312026.1 glycosyltransferase family 2 protein [Clostridium tagluense]MCB2316613.1 glycosyltransferase family 2 protein [Clostridium tagluense]MCB2321451.1 glycosyltransferase family 2 protein [Clostridium tagluense]MCB2326463.1 glycosyltransferase family 2 protein [Clostridium tagluense]MCB2331205.1 glycosyltransferase family 2 protein [Clostridium tagluense]